MLLTVLEVLEVMFEILVVLLVEVMFVTLVVVFMLVVCREKMGSLVNNCHLSKVMSTKIYPVFMFGIVQI